MLKRNTIMAFVAIAAIGLLAACGSGRDDIASSAAEPGSGDSTLSGAIVLDGSSTVAPLATVLAEKFEAQAPNVRVTVGTSGTGGGFEKFCNGETDVSNASRAIKDEEKALCADKGITFIEILVANDGLSLVTNTANDWATCLTTDQLMAIWGPDSKATTWQEIDPTWPAEKLNLYGPGTDSGTFDYFTEEINGEGGASRTDYSPSEDDNVTIQGVTGEKGGLGYFGLSYYEQNTDKLKLMEIDGGNGCVAPSTKTVQDGSYTPLSRPLYLYVSNTASSRPEVQAFFQYFVDNEAAINTEALFVPLSADQLATAKTEVAGLAG